MTAPEDFDRLGDLLGDFCEAATPSDPFSGRPGELGLGRPKHQPEPSPLGGGSEDLSRAVAVVWPEVAGAETASHAVPVRLKDGRLTVSTSSSVWAHSLQYMSAELMERLNERLGEGAIKQMVFRHAGWEESTPHIQTTHQVTDASSGVALSKEQEQALEELEDLELPPAIRDTIARAMRASFVRGQ